MSRGLGDDDFRAEMDISTMQEAQRIANDPARSAKARTAARNRAIELMELAEGGEETPELATFRRGFNRP